MARLFDDGSSQYLDYAGAVVTGTPLSIAFWFYHDDDATSSAGFAIGDDAPTNNSFILWLSSGGDNDVKAAARDGGAEGQAIATAFYGINAWHHACGVFTSSTLRAAFLDGSNKGTNATDVTPAGLDHTYIGRTNLASPWEYFMSGRIAEAAVWNAALTDAEVAVLATGASPLFARPQSLVAYWRLIRGDQDLVGGYDLTAHGSPTVAAHVPKMIYPAPAFWLAPAAAAPAGAGLPVLSGGDGVHSLVFGGVTVR